jgi:hypothetical protein
MAGELSYVTRLASWLAEAAADSEPLFTGFYTDQLGTVLPAAVRTAPAVTTALTHAAVAARDLRPIATALDTTDPSDTGGAVPAFIQLGVKLAAFFAALDELASAVGSSVTPATVPNPSERAAAQSFATQLAERIGEYAIVSGLTDHMPELAFVLRLLGLIDWQRVVPVGAPLASSYVVKRLALHRFKDLVSDPATHFANVHHWGRNDFDPTPLFQLFAGFFDVEDAIAVGERDGDPVLQYGFLTLRRDRTLSPPGLRLTLEAALTEAFEQRIALGRSDWGVRLREAITLSGSVGGTIKPPLSLALVPAEADIKGELTATFDRNPEARPFDILGGSGTLSLGAQNLAAGVGLTADWDVTSHTAHIEPLLFANLEKLKLNVSTEGSDSFIATLLSSADIEGEFDLGLEWRASTGLKVTASGGIEISLPIHQKLGPLELDTIYFALKIQDDGTLAFETSVGLSGKLGPLAASVERMGAELDVRFTDSTDADFGFFDLDLRFKPPSGVGLSLDAGAVRGGGYLFFDFDRGEYAGVVQLSVLDLVSITAIGLISTKLPDGSSGFSLLVIISVEFSPGIQLGMGFTLIGLGGLVGLNRTMLLDPLVAGVRSGTVNSILFPQGDIIANAPRIISDLRAIFPPKLDTFLIGPMAKLGWGTPTLVSVSLGIIIEIPGNIAILGVLRLNLPTADAPLLVLQVAFVGAIEFDKQRLWFFASLFESRVLFITLEGEMGLLVGWGSDAAFVFSVGGFHPRFTPPPLPFPSPNRIALCILNEDWGVIRAETYFAVTSNTVQLGAAVDLRFGFDAFGIQGHLGFDALFQFSPFHFIISVDISLSLKVAGLDLLSVRVDLSLEGPTPWHAFGTGHVSLLFFEISADFDVTWGESADTTLPPVAVVPLFEAELQDRANWTSALPASNHLSVSLRALDEAADELVMHPLGTLRFSQRLLPLGIPLDKLGTQRPSDAKEFELLVATPDLESKGEVREGFAMAQFQDMDDATKLSRPSFEQNPSGLDIGAAGDPLATDHMAVRNVRYEEILIDGEFRKHQPLRRPLGGLFLHELKGAAIKRGELSDERKKQLDPFRDGGVSVKSEPHTVAAIDTNQPYVAAAEFASEAEARAHLASLIAADPRLSNKLHVIPSYEVAA